MKTPPISKFFSSSLKSFGIELFCLFIALFYTTSAHAWWDCAWSKRVQLVVTNNGAAALVNPQIEVNLGGVDGASVPGYVWNRVDADLRMVAQDDNTLLTHWVEPRPATATDTKIWVTVPTTIAVGASYTLYAYYDNAVATSLSSIAAITNNNSLLYHSRNSTVDPTSLSTWKSAWIAASDGITGYACAQPSTLHGLSNGNMVAGGNNSNILFRLEGMFYVSSAQAGTWSFRMAGDFGRGGGVYVDWVPLQENWNVNLWWGGNWANTAAILQGSTNLGTGWHVLRGWGAEDCCDGAGGFQFLAPGSTTWLDVNSTNLSVRNAGCNRLLAGPGASQAAIQGPVFRLTKTSVTLSDPVNGATNPKAIPGSQIGYSITAAHTSGYQADAASVSILEAVPTNLRLCGLASGGSGVTFVQGSINSGVTVSNIKYSNNGGSTFSYTPVADGLGCDAAITHIKVTTTGTMSCKTSAGEPSFRIDLKTLLN